MFLRIVHYLVAASTMLGLFLIAIPKSEPESLLVPAAWTNDGNFFQFSLDFISPLDLPKTFITNSNLVLWRSWSPDRGPTAGTLVSFPIRAPQFLAVPFYGFPHEVEDNRIYLRCDDHSTTLEIASHLTGNQWGVAYLWIDPTFCLGLSRIVAQSLSGKFEVGVGTPYKIDAATYFANTTFFPRFALIVFVWGWLCIFVLAFSILVSQEPTHYALIQSVAAIGVIGMIAFILFHFSPIAGTFFSWLILFCSAGSLLRSYSRDPGRLKRFAASYSGAASTWLCISVAYAAFAAAIDNGGGVWNINALFSPVRWSTDNQLPSLFAEALFTNAPREKIQWGVWLASDRPPLLSGLLLLFRSTIVQLLFNGVGTNAISSFYATISIVILASWSGIIYLIASEFERSRATTVVALALVTPFFLFDTIFVWPKLLGASYSVLAFYVLFRMSRGEQHPFSLVTVATCAALALLSHGSSAFALFPICVLFARSILRCGLAKIALATFAAALCILPWLWWQAFVQPNGNALIRVALSNDFGFDKRETPIWDSVMAAYSHLTIISWLKSKWDSIVVLSGMRTDWIHFGPSLGATKDWRGGSRLLDFFQVTRFLGIGSIGLLGFAASAPWRGQSLKSELVCSAAIAGISGLLFTLLITLTFPITAHQPFGSLMLIFLAGSLAIAASPLAVRALAIIAATAYFLIVWIAPPIETALRVEYVSLAISLIAVLALAAAMRDMRRMDEKEEAGYRPTDLDL